VNWRVVPIETTDGGPLTTEDLEVFYVR
jgi:hypothetical protein